MKPKTVKECLERVQYAMSQAYIWLPNNPVAHEARRHQWENIAGELAKLDVLPRDYVLKHNPWEKQ